VAFFVLPILQQDRDTAPKSAVARADIEHAADIFCVFVRAHNGLGMLRDTDRLGQYVACDRLVSTESIIVALMLTIERDRTQALYGTCFTTSLRFCFSDRFINACP